MRIILTLFIIIIFQRGTSQDVQNFHPEIISQFPNVRDIALMPSENEFYFTMQSYLGELSSIVCVKLENNKYSKPEIATFSGKFHDLEPFLSPDGLRLFFSSNRPLDNTSNQTKDYDIWFVQRETLKSLWSEPINMGYPINTKDNEFYPSISQFNNLYFTCDGLNSKGKDDIFVSKWKNGKYELPLSMNESINSEGIEFNAFIAPDESFLIYTCYNRKEGFGSGDLYISFNQGNDQWTKSKNMGNVINSDKMDYCPFVNLKNGTLYFTSKRNKIKTQFEKPQNIEAFLSEMNSYENGLSRLYQIKFKP